MPTKSLFLLVEGDDDERFFSSLIKSHFKQRFPFAMIWRYAEETRKRVSDFVRSIDAMGGTYLFLVDCDTSPCITAKKDEVIQKYPGVDASRIVVVCAEIEAWYLAGLKDVVQKQWKFAIKGSTDAITKEKFNQLISSRFDSRVDCMREILKLFSVEFAKSRNQSFRYFIDKHFS